MGISEPHLDCMEISAAYADSMEIISALKSMASELNQLLYDPLTSDLYPPEIIFSPLDHNFSQAESDSSNF